MIGNHTYIGPNYTEESVVIWTPVWIASSCAISKCVVIKDRCHIHDGTVVPPEYSDSLPSVPLSCLHVFQRLPTSDLVRNFFEHALSF